MGTVQPASDATNSRMMPRIGIRALKKRFYRLAVARSKQVGYRGRKESQSTGARSACQTRCAWRRQRPAFPYGGAPGAALAAAHSSLVDEGVTTRVVITAHDDVVGLGISGAAINFRNQFILAESRVL
jgi:hypothetical protein